MKKMTEVKNHYNVIIIGAGVAGLTAGKHLFDNNERDFVILESANNVGGRIRTTKFGNETFPTGAGWIHGCKGNPIYDIANELDVKIEECQTESDNLYYVWDNERNCDVSEEYLEKRKQLSTELENIQELREYYDESNKNVSIRDFLLKHSPLFRDIDAMDKTTFFTTAEIYYGSSWRDISAWALLYQPDEVYLEEEGERNFKILESDGVTKIIKFLSKDIRNQIRLNSKVKSICWTDNEGVRVQLADGSILTTDWLIVTIQSNVLAEGYPKITPEVPKWKQDAWEAVPAVDYCRLLARWKNSDRFWGDQEWLVRVCENPENELTYWQNCSGQNLMMGQSALVCHVTGGFDSTRFGNMPEDELKDEVMKSLGPMYGGNIARPTEVRLVSHWNENLRWKGSFSCFGLTYGPETAANLAAPVGRMLFAGESTCASLLGTLQGSYKSATDVCSMILSRSPLA